MKNIQSINEGQWVEKTPIEMTKEERLGFLDKNEQTLNSLKNRKIEKQPNNKELQKAQEIYLANKPVLKDNDTYELISADITIEENKTRGIINYRINGQHKQIRF